MLSFLGDTQLQTSLLLDIDSLKGTLTIKETQHANAGDYTCVAVNAAGTSSGKISLDVGGESDTRFSYFKPSNKNIVIYFNLDYYRYLPMFWTEADTCTYLSVH